MSGKADKTISWFHLVAFHSRDQYDMSVPQNRIVWSLKESGDRLCRRQEIPEEERTWIFVLGTPGFKSGLSCLQVAGTLASHLTSEFQISNCYMRIIVPIFETLRGLQGKQNKTKADTSTPTGTHTLCTSKCFMNSSRFYKKIVPCL